MNLLFKRSQKSAALFSLIPLRIGSGVIFHLHAELELDPEEQTLITHYKFTNTPIVVSDLFDDVKQAVRPAVILGFVSFIVLWILFSFFTAMQLAFLITAVMTVVYFKTLREQILVSDLLDGGRTFRCDSIVELINKEAYLEHIAGYLRQILESAKNWHNREAIAIRPLTKADAKQAVLQISRGY